MDDECEIFVYGRDPLPCPIGDLEDDVFDRIEGFGDVTGSGCGAAGWNLDIAFDSPNSFIEIVHAVLQALQNQGIDPEPVTVSIHGRRRKLVDLL